MFLELSRIRTRVQQPTQGMRGGHSDENRKTIITKADEQVLKVA